MLARRCVAFVFALAFMLLALIATAQDVQPDQTIAVLLTTAPGAPTADDLVAYYEGQQLGPPPLQGLTVGNPQKIVYLMPMVGFMVYNVVNANAEPGVLDNYGGAFAHRSTLDCGDVNGQPCPDVGN